MPKADRKAGLRMDTQTFLHIWSETLKRDTDDDPSQMEFMVEKCLETFLGKGSKFRDQNIDFLDQNAHATESELNDLKRVIQKRVYSKCSNLRKTFKDSGYEPPAFPKKGSMSYEPTIIDYAAIMGLEPSKRQD